MKKTYYFVEDDTPRVYSVWDRGIISVVRYLLAVALFIGSICFLEKTTGCSEPWLNSTIIGGVAFLLLTEWFMFGYASDIDEDAYRSRIIAKFSFMMGIIGISIQAFFFIPWPHALVGTLSVPLMWVLLPRIYPTSPRWK